MYIYIGLREAICASTTAKLLKRMNTIQGNTLPIPPIPSISTSQSEVTPQYDPNSNPHSGVLNRYMVLSSTMPTIHPSTYPIPSFYSPILLTWIGGAVFASIKVCCCCCCISIGILCVLWVVYI